jgi:uncharacterized protein (TIGR02145 family)
MIDQWNGTRVEIRFTCCKWFVILFALVSLAFASSSINHKAGNPLKNAKNKSSANVTTVKDADGNVYHFVKIGTQIWTVENLRTTKFNDSTPIPYVTEFSAWKVLTSPGYCWYDNNTKNAATYGALYNWYAVNTRRLAPAGWHVPTDAEWETLQNYLITNGYNWDETTIGNKIAKSMAANTDWYTSPTAERAGAIETDLTANNRSGFSALPGGCRGPTSIDGDFLNVVYFGYWWSATESDQSEAYFRELNYVHDYLFKTINYKSGGFSVRLLKD